MRIYTSPKEEHRWIFQPFRSVFKGAGREEKIRQTAKELDFRYLSVYSTGDALQAAYTSERDGYDFAARFHSYCLKAGMNDVVYVERSSNEHNVIVIVRDGHIKRDKVGKTEEIKADLESMMGSANLENVKLINYQFLENGVLEKANQIFSGRIENLSGALTDKLEPTEDYAFLLERDAMSKIKSRRPWLLYLGIIGIVVLGVNQLASLTSNEVEKTVVVDPYASFYQAMSSDVIQVLNRMAQDYNTHVGLMTLPGWTVDKVTHTKGQVSFRMMSTENGDVETLKAFARQNGLHVMIEPNEIVLLGLGANVTSTDESQIKMYNVEEVHHFLRDAVNEYIPGAELTFVRDVPKGTDKKWTIRELMFQFRGIYKEDLMTLGAITKSLPVSIGGDSADPNAGQYIIDDERFTGGLKISVFGEKI